MDATNQVLVQREEERTEIWMQIWTFIHKMEMNAAD